MAHGEDRGDRALPHIRSSPRTFATQLFNGLFGSLLRGQKTKTGQSDLPFSSVNILKQALYPKGNFLSRMHIHPSGGRLWCREQDRTAVCCSAPRPSRSPGWLSTLHLPGSFATNMWRSQTPSSETGLETSLRSRVTATYSDQIPCPAIRAIKKMCVSPAETPGAQGGKQTRAPAPQLRG